MISLSIYGFLHCVAQCNVDNVRTQRVSPLTIPPSSNDGGGNIRLAYKFLKIRTFVSFKIVKQFLLFSLFLFLIKHKLV